MSVVEVGIRQAWPFLTFAAEDGSERRLYIDSSVQLRPALSGQVAQGDPELWAALIDLDMLTVDEAAVLDDGSIRIEFDGAIELTVSGEPNQVTTSSPWRVAQTGSA